MAFDISAFKRRCFEKSRPETQLILEAANEALTVLEYIVNDLVPHDVLSFAPDIVPIKAARSAVFLVSVSLVDARPVMTSDSWMFYPASQYYRTRSRPQGDLPHTGNRGPIQAAESGKGYRLLSAQVLLETAQHRYTGRHETCFSACQSGSRHEYQVIEHRRRSAT